MEIMVDLKSRSLVSQQSTNSKNHIDDSPAVCDISTGCIANDKTEIQKLNDDCLMHIFTYIPRGNRFVLEKVCRRWETISRCTWRTFKKFDLEVETWGDNSTYENLRNMKIVTLQKVLYRCGSFLTHIDLSERSRYCESEKVVSVFAKYCTNLQYINIPNSTERAFHQNPIYEKELSKLFLNNKKIRYVRLVNASITGKCLLDLSADFLETLIIIFVLEISPCYFEKVVKKFQKLRTLLLISCFTLTSKTFETISFCAKSLKELQLSETTLRMGRSCYELLHIREFVNLEILDVHFNDYINDEALKMIGEKCKKLKKINVSECNRISNKGLANIVSLPKLEQLNIDWLDEITDEILTDMPNLRKLSCSFSKKVKDQGLCRLIKNSHNLEILNVTGCKVSNELVKVAIKATKNRTNNVTLKIYVSETNIDIDYIATAVSPFLQLRREINLSFFENEESKF